MDFVQRKTADSAVEQLIREASEKGIPLVWDRYEVHCPVRVLRDRLELPDCLQGPVSATLSKRRTRWGFAGRTRRFSGSIPS